MREAGYGELKMPTLLNPRHELYAQALVLGKHQDIAYAEAGFNRNKGNASTLKNKPAVQNRIQELLEEKASLLVQTMGKELEVTKETLLAELEEARQVAYENDQAAAMVSATVAKARITGNIIDRREVGEAGAFDGMTDEELVADAARRARELGIVGPQLVEDDNKKSL